MSPARLNHATGRLFGATAVIVLGALLAGTYGQTCLTSRQLASNFISRVTWLSFVKSYQNLTNGTPEIDLYNIPFSITFVPCFVVAIATWIAGAIWLRWHRRIDWTEAFILWGWYGGLWWCLVDVWEWLWIAAGAVGLTGLSGLLSVTPQFWLAGCISGWMTTWLLLNATPNSSIGHGERPFRTRWLWAACGAYFVIFTAMNGRLFANLLVPHGDSVMYEEHLWNLLHGKGFRSYLDQGLFLGEHIQFVHLFLLPLYAIWPSHLLLEACSSASLACGAFPVFWMVRRHTNSGWTAFAIALAYLTYFPMQFLDIEIDLKTFRPESFGIPLLLLTLDQLDRRCLIGTLFGMGLCLTVKEDYALVFGPLGLWIAVASPPLPKIPTVARTPSSDVPRVARTPSPDFSETSPKASHPKTDVSDRPSPVTAIALNDTDGRGRPSHGVLWNSRSRLALGLSISVFSVAYLWLATRVIMPWFRSGAEVHYASYFARFGNTPEKIVRTILSNPALVFESLATIETALYAIALLAPLAFLPILAPGRMAVGVPLFAILCLNELEGSRTPQHQFHAPLVAILFWSLAAALPRAILIGSAITKRFGSARDHDSLRLSEILPRLVVTSTLATGFFFSLSPLGICFWDSGSAWNWRKLYGPSHRAAMFARIATSLPKSVRVASTDFVHPRFTHYDRSYDYSGYHRKVSGEGQRIPDDTEYLVIDTQHRYSTMKKPDDIPEWRNERDRWELLPDVTEGYFIVLKRKPTSHETTPTRSE